jgi:hypothetical protein
MLDWLLKILRALSSESQSQFFQVCFFALDRWRFAKIEIYRQILAQSDRLMADFSQYVGGLNLANLLNCIVVEENDFVRNQLWDILFLSLKMRPDVRPADIEVLSRFVLIDQPELPFELFSRLFGIFPLLYPIKLSVHRKLLSLFEDSFYFRFFALISKEKAFPAARQFATPTAWSLLAHAFLVNRALPPFSVVIALSHFVSDDALVQFLLNFAVKTVFDSISSDRFLLVTFAALLVRFLGHDSVLHFLSRLVCHALCNGISLDFLLLFSHTFLAPLVRVCEAASEIAPEAALEPLAVLVTKLACVHAPAFTLTSLSDLFRSGSLPLEVSAASPDFMTLLAALVPRFSPSPATVALFSALRPYLPEPLAPLLSEWGLSDSSPPLLPATAGLLAPPAPPAPITVTAFRLPLLCARDCLTVSLQRAVAPACDAQCFDRGFRPAFTAAADPSPFPVSFSACAVAVNGRSVLCHPSEDALLLGGLRIPWSSIRFFVPRGTGATELFLADGRMLLVGFSSEFLRERVPALTADSIRERFAAGALSLPQLALELSFLAGRSFNSASPPTIPEAASLPDFIRESFPFEDRPPAVFSAPPLCVGQAPAGVAALLARNGTVFAVDRHCAVSGFRPVLHADNPRPTLETVLRYRPDNGGPCAAFLPVHCALAVAGDREFAIHFVTRGKCAARAQIPVPGGAIAVATIGDDTFLACAGAALTIIPIGGETRIITPGERIACFAASEWVGVVVVCDVRRTITVASLADGERLTRFRIAAVPYRMIVLDSAEIVAIAGRGGKCVSWVYGFDGELRRDAIFEGSPIEAVLIDTDRYENLIAISFGNSRVDLIDPVSMRVVRSLTVSGVCRFMSYDRLGHMFVYMGSEKLINVLFVDGFGIGA